MVGVFCRIPVFMKNRKRQKNGTLTEYYISPRTLTEYFFSTMKNEKTHISSHLQRATFHSFFFERQTKFNFHNLCNSECVAASLLPGDAQKLTEHILHRSSTLSNILTEYRQVNPPLNVDVSSFLVGLSCNDDDDDAILTSPKCLSADQNGKHVQCERCLGRNLP